MALDLSSNQISGRIPPELGDLSNLSYLSVDTNKLIGSIPLSFINLDALDDFYFSNTYLCEPNTQEFQHWKETVLTWTGTDIICFDCSTVEIPQVECEALVALYEDTLGPEWTNHTNWLETTTINEWFGVTLNDNHVSRLQIHTNNLKGSIPPELGDLDNLQILNFYGNQLSGSIPPKLGNLSNLTTLYLSDNQLTGTIPPGLGNLSNLQILSFNGNQLRGNIPPELGNLSSLVGLYLKANQLSGTIPPRLGNLASLMELYLSENQLSGSIPPELGNLSSLVGLNLNSNQLSGSIPLELGKLTNLVLFYLFENPLRGSLPMTLVNLTKLSNFSFLHTNLCEPANSDFQDWKKTIVFYDVSGLTCHAPVALADAYATAEDTQLVKAAAQGVLANDSDADGDVLSAELVADVSNGSLTLSADGSFTYMPGVNFFGEDIFTYKTFDTVEYSEIVSVTITVTQVTPTSFTIFLPITLR